MKTINHYYVKAIFSDGVCNKKERDQKCEVVTINIIAKNDQMLCLETDLFQTVRHARPKKDRHDFYCYVDTPSLGFSLNDNIWGTYVSYSLYTNKAKTFKQIKKEMEAYINKKIGHLTGIDLSFIKDEK